MEMHTVLAAVFCGFTALFLYLTWWMVLARVPTPTPAASLRRVSWAIVIYLLFWKALLYESRPDLLALMEEGMSDSNIKQAIFIAVAAAWAAFLVTTGRVRAGALIAGPSFWVTSLTIVYLASAIWSVWLEYTVFRVLELATFWIISLHLFPVNDWVRQLGWFLLLATLAEWLQGLLGYQRFSEGVVLGAIYTNSGSLMAGALFIVAVQQSIATDGKPKWGWISFSCLSIVVFGSLTTAAASVIALALIMALWIMRRAEPVAIAVVALLMTIGMTAFGAFMLTADATGIAELFGKDAEHIGTMTGRLPLWSAIWEVSKGEPFGSGYGAAERFVTSLIGDRFWVGWTAGHSHNGFISAWLAAGFPGFLLSICLVLSILTATVRMSIGDRVLVVPLMILMIINNMSFPAFGGQFNPAWLIIMAVVCGPCATLPARCPVRRRKFDPAGGYVDPSIVRRRPTIASRHRCRRQSE
jgi:O-antigen ligase